METFAAVMTGKGTGPIATIQVFGAKAEAVIKKIFTPAAAEPAKFKAGQILLGTIDTKTETIDQVIIGCENAHSFTINCHGNPLIVADIMKLLTRHKVTPLSAEELLAKILIVQKNLNTIQIEAKLAQSKARTLEGTKIISNQIEGGLNKTAQRWLKNINTTPLDEIIAEARRILSANQIAKLIIHGCKAAIAGPPNTGKSTLLNYLAGSQKAIVTDIKGTTRDYVTAECRIGPLCVEFIDTAGVDEQLPAAPDSIETKAQQAALRILADAELILLVLDNSRPTEQLEEYLVEKITAEKVACARARKGLRRSKSKVLTVLNKSDLPARFDTGNLPQGLKNTVKISAKFGTGIETLIKKIHQLTGVTGFDYNTAVCFTNRQENLLKKLKNAKSADQAASVITELLNGQV